jgi:PhnB protein
MAKIPEGHHTVTPAMVVPGVAKLIEFLEAAFGGRVVDRYDAPGGVVAHAEVQIGDSVVMMGDPMPEAGFPAMPAMLSLYVDDCDAVYRRALSAGATSVEEPANQFYGHRTARVRDPSGNLWAIATVIEELSREEMHRRMPPMGPP